MAKYCHYWNGRFLQQNEQYEEAIASYETVVKNYPDLALADDADFGIVECLYAQGKLALAQEHNTKIQTKYQDSVKTSSTKYDMQTAVQQLSQDMEERFNRALELK